MQEADLAGLAGLAGLAVEMLDENMRGEVLVVPGGIHYTPTQLRLTAEFLFVETRLFP